MPLTAFQASVLALLAPQRSDASYLAGGAALHIGPAGERFSDDLDFFHNAADAANQSFAVDASALRARGYEVNTIAEHRGFVSAVVRRDGESTILDWAHESAWRFLPLVPIPGGGVMLHPIDLATGTRKPLCVRCAAIRRSRRWSSQRSRGRVTNQTDRINATLAE